MTTDDHLTVETPTNADLALTLGGWVSSLAGDARALAEASTRGSGASMRAGLRHLLHIVPLSRGIESLAMLEVAIVLRVTAQQAEATEDGESSPIAKLRAETAHIEVAFPDENAAIWEYCEGLVARERELIARLEASSVEPTEVETSADEVTRAEPTEVETSADEVTRAEPTEADVSPLSDPAEVAASDNEASPLVAKDELIERVLSWAETYQPPSFGNRPHDLTRAHAFIRTRIEAWTAAS